MISWRNPDARHRDWGLDTYGQAILDAHRRRPAITGAEPAALQGFCSGGTLQSMLLGRARSSAGSSPTGWPRSGSRCASSTRRRPGSRARCSTSRPRRRPRRRRKTRGYLDGRRLAEVFAWLRPNDLIWNYWVNNYLQGKDPAPFDILFWNADTTRMTAGLHRDFLDLGLRNALVQPGRGDACSAHRVDLVVGRPPTRYVVAGVADHISPWQSCYRSTQLFGGRHPVRAVHQRAHRRHRQPAHQPQGELPGLRATSGPSRTTWPRTTETTSGLLVAGLPRLAGRAQRAGAGRARPRSAAAGFPPLDAGSRHATSLTDERIRLLAGPHGRGRWAAAAGRRARPATRAAPRCCC